MTISNRKSRKAQTASAKFSNISEESACVTYDLSEDTDSQEVYLKLEVENDSINAESLLNDDDHHITIDQNEDFSPTVDENQFEGQKGDSENFDDYAYQNGQPIKVEDGANDGSFLPESDYKPEVTMRTSPYRFCLSHNKKLKFSCEERIIKCNGDIGRKKCGLEFYDVEEFVNGCFFLLFN